MNPRQQINMRRACVKAFGLTELLVVVAIIAVLAILGFPALQQVNEKGKKAKCVGNLRQLHAALMAYAGEHGGFFPKAVHEDENGSSSWLVKLRVGGYIPNVGKAESPGEFINFCPASTVRFDDGTYRDYVGNYGINQLLVGSFVTNPPTDDPSFPISRISTPVRTLLLFDAGNSSLKNVSVNTPGQPAYLPGIPPNKKRSWKFMYSADALYGRHGGRINVMMVDGHVESWSHQNFLDNMNAWKP